LLHKKIEETEENETSGEHGGNAAVVEEEGITADSREPGHVESVGIVGVSSSVVDSGTQVIQNTRSSTSSGFRLNKLSGGAKTTI